MLSGDIYNRSVKMKRREFLKQLGASTAGTLVLSNTVVHLVYRLQGDLTVSKHAGPSSPSSVSFENEMPDVTIDSYVGQIPNLKPDAYHHRYVAFTNPGETLYFSVNNPSSNLIVDFSKKEDAINPGTWYVDVFFRSLGDVSSDTVEFVFSDAPVAIENPSGNVPKHFSLSHPYPNPFNSSVRVDYELPYAMGIDASVYNTLGQVVSRLASGRQPAGKHSFLWTPSADVSSGAYFFVLKTPLGRQTRKGVYEK